jgi:hypothetical protein
VRNALAILAALIPLASTPQENVPSLLRMAAEQGIKQLGAGSETMFLYRFTRAGQRRDALVLTPATKFETTPLQSATLRCVSLLAAMPFNLGDGATLSISLKASGQERRTLQLDLDPAHVRAHRAWLPIRFGVPSDLGDFTIVFEVTAGTRGDQTGDWVGLSSGTDKSCLFGS